MRICEPDIGHIHGLRDLWKLVFGDGDDFLEVFFGTAYAPERCLCIMDADTAAGALYWLPCDNYAYIYAVATHPDHRGRGFAKKLVRAVLETAEFDKIYVLISRKNAPSIAVHTACGFRKIFDYAVYADGSVLHSSDTYLYEKPRCS